MRPIDHLGEAVADIDIRPAGVMSVEQIRLCKDNELEGMAAKHKSSYCIMHCSNAAQVEEVINKHLRILRTLTHGGGDRLVENINGLRAMLVLHQRQQNGIRFFQQTVVAKQEGAAGMPNSDTVELEDAPHSPYGGFQKMIGTFKGTGVSMATGAGKMTVPGRWLAQYPLEMCQAAHPAHGGRAVEADEDDIALQDEVASQQTTDRASQRQDDDEEVQQQSTPQAAGGAGPSTALSRSKRPLPFEEVVATKMRRLMQQEESLTALQAELLDARQKKCTLEDDVRQCQQQEQLIKQQLVAAEVVSAATREADAKAARDVATLEAKLHAQRQLLRDFLQREVVAEFEARWS